MIKDTISRYRNKSILGRQKSSVQPLSYDQAHEIGILINIEDVYNVSKINEFVRKLENDNKKLKIICYHKKEHLDLFHFDHIYLNNKDFKWYGKFNNDIIKEFTEKNFDFIYVISKKSIWPFESILVSSNAKCKIGPYEAGKEVFYDFMIKNPEEKEESNKVSCFDSFLDQMLLYSKLLSK